MSESGVMGSGTRALVGLGWLALIPVFCVGLYVSAKTGIAIADRQVPPGSLSAPGDLESGSRWVLEKPGLAVAGAIDALRDYAFARSGSGDATGEGVERLGKEALGWELQVLEGGDRRYRRAKYLSGGRQGDEVWVIGADLRAFGRPSDDNPVQN